MSKEQDFTKKIFILTTFSSLKKKEQFNFKSYRVLAFNVEEAIGKICDTMGVGEHIQEVRFVAHAEYE